MKFLVILLIAALGCGACASTGKSRASQPTGSTESRKAGFGAAGDFIK